MIWTNRIYQSGILQAPPKKA